MSARDEVLEKAGKVVVVWQRTFDHVPDDLEDAVIELKAAIEAMVNAPHARVTDPKTSKQGPKGMKLSQGRTLVLNRLRAAGRPLTDHELVHSLQGVMSASGVRSRRAELVRMGLARPTGYSTRMVLIDGDAVQLPRAQNKWEASS